MPPQPLFQAVFEARIVAGVNRIEVKYEQPLGLDETQHGYFTSSEFAFTFGYELWPLEEWRRSDTFALSTSISVPRERSWLDLIREPDPRVTCVGASRDRRERTSLDLRRRLGDESDTYTIEQRDFPDTLQCSIESDAATAAGRARFGV